MIYCFIFSACSENDGLRGLVKMADLYSIVSLSIHICTNDSLLADVIFLTPSDEKLI